MAEVQRDAETMSKTGVHVFAPPGQSKPIPATERAAASVGRLQKSKTGIYVVGAALIISGGVAWYMLSRPALPPGFAAGNGRLEANEIYVATKYAGRVKEVLFKEGDTVEN